MSNIADPKTKILSVDTGDFEIELEEDSTLSFGCRNKHWFTRVNGNAYPMCLMRIDYPVRALISTRPDNLRRVYFIFENGQYQFQQLKYFSFETNQIYDLANYQYIQGFYLDKSKPSVSNVLIQTNAQVYHLYRHYIYTWRAEFIIFDDREEQTLYRDHIMQDDLIIDTRNNNQIRTCKLLFYSDNRLVLINDECLRVVTKMRETVYYHENIKLIYYKLNEFLYAVMDEHIIAFGINKNHFRLGDKSIGLFQQIDDNLWMFHVSDVNGVCHSVEVDTSIVASVIFFDYSILGQYVLFALGDGNVIATGRMKIAYEIENILAVQFPASVLLYIQGHNGAITSYLCSIREDGLVWSERDLH